MLRLIDHWGFERLDFDVVHRSQSYLGNGINHVLERLFFIEFLNKLNLVILKDIQYIDDAIIAMIIEVCFT